MISIRCSALPRVCQCPASAEAPEVKIDGAGRPAKLGRAVHAVLATIVSENMDDVPDLQRYIEAEGLDFESDEKELRFLSYRGLEAWRKLRGEFEYIAVERELRADQGGFELTGHADILGKLDSGGPLVIDWKSGYAENEDYADQLKGYLDLAWRQPELLGMGESGKIVTVWLRSGSAEVLTVHPVVLQGWRDRLKESLDSGHYNAGEHCKWCPRQYECDARRQALRGASAWLVEFDPKEYRYTDLLDAYDRAQLVKKALAVYERELKAYVEHQAKPVQHGGRVFEMASKSRDTVSVHKAWPVLRDAFSVGDDDQLIELLGDSGVLTVSLTALKKEVAETAERGKKGKRIDLLLEKLENAEALERTAYKSLSVKKEKG